MERLRPGWYLEELFDAEYQQYRLLAYLRKVSKEFLAQKVYPSLGDLVASYMEMTRISEELHHVSSEDDPQIATLEDIVSFSLPRLESAIEEGKNLFDTIAHTLEVHAVGVVPLHRDEGYLFLRRGTESTIRVYVYEIRHLYTADTQQVAIHLSYLREYSYSAFSLGFLRVREHLLKEYPHLPVPYTLAVESPWIVPIEETLLPIIRRSLPQWAKETPPHTLG
ncbi:MAG: hypothetical protein NZZ60_00445 [Bacteroidia bacterium]|nr:hypothetical protein [Bacteroidia bacterium]MCX7651567.1 hypothetical protein [Bacteroidia bacterium]MDW8417257.1 hypothetical protein [Bacteroidia bacterium]